MLTESDLAAIEAAIVHDPFGHMPDSVFRQAGTFRPKLDGIPVEIKRADLRALLADLRAARQERDQAGEENGRLRHLLTLWQQTLQGAISALERGRHTDLTYDKIRADIACGLITYKIDKGLRALAATKEEKAE